ncbi:hypothetical protein GCM10022419_033350 [Nonomuraea rosea]|uniref:Uncharacterized protein n=1 Tax=Nonomuraea rosea TaxID=638574 RepID=A0ABP6WGJ7_9ACTN
MTILSPTRSTAQTAEPLLTDFDVLDIAEAIRNAVAYNAVSLDARDRQALALFTYVPELRGITRMLLAKLVNGTAALPMARAMAMHLLDMHADDDLLPEPAWNVQEAWLAARDAAALPAWKDDATRADLAHVPHSITVEPITPELRRDSGLPAHATLVVVERHAGRLAKVCGTTDVSVADYTEFGHAVTIEALARGIAHTYGATYVESAAAVNA